MRAKATLAGFVSLSLFLTLGVVPAHSSEPWLSLLPRDGNGWYRVEGHGIASAVYTLSASSNLTAWQTIAVLHGDAFVYADPGSADAAGRFYRASAVPREATNDWKNQVSFPYDEFTTAYGVGSEGWIKFAIMTNEPGRVFYAYSGFGFHYDFATARLEPLRGLSGAEFERVSLLNQGRRVLLGTVLYPHGRNTELGIQFVSQDVLPREVVRDAFRLVSSTVVRPPGVTAYYIPTFEQLAAAQADRDYFTSNGIPVSTAERWAVGDVCYSSGWGIGRLVFVSATNVNAAYARGDLRPTDILLTDGIPAELPYVSGIISLTPSTANSHVAILARSYGVPFLYLVNDVERMRVLQLTNREVVVQAGLASGGICKALVVGVDAALDPMVRAEIVALKSAPPLALSPKQRFGAYAASTEDRLPSDIQYFGGKAANYGLLRRTIPSNAPAAIAFSFDLWDDFMEQALSNGRTLRQEISNRLAGFTYPPDVAALQTALAAIRTLLRQSTQFSSAQRADIQSALAVFQPGRNIRFRSSTNVEDSESFSGAGLYDSYSGCLLDDLDGDNQGPSACDPTEPDERGVYRAMRRVYASFYNDNAYLERLRHGVDETTVGMAMLVHHSTPDPVEMANGVATITYRRGIAPVLEGDLVTQLGAVSVANPDGSAFPEEVQIYQSLTNDALYLDLRTYSSLLPRGAYVMDWETDYRALSAMLLKVAQGYGDLFPDRAHFLLDLEYKKVDPGVLEIKQVREIPVAPVAVIEPYLLNQPTVFVNYQGYYANLWTAHRLKSRWTVTGRTMHWTQSNITAGVLTDVVLEHISGTNIQTLSGPLSSFPGAIHVYTNYYSLDRWLMDTAAGPARMDLFIYDNRDNVTTAQPFFSLSDLRPTLEAVHQQFVPFIDNINSPGEVRFGTNELTYLRPALVETPGDSFRQFHFTMQNQGTTVVVRTSCWVGSTETFGDIPPLIRFVETTIEGLTANPIVLRSYWSQTFSATHRVGSETFLFEPRLEPGLPTEQLAELNASNIASLYLNRNGTPRYEDGQVFVEDHPVLFVIGLEGEFRPFTNFGDRNP